MRLAWLILIVGVGSAPLAAGAELLVGIAETDITPESPYGLSGYYHERKSTGNRDRLHAKAIVLRQGSESVALVECDLCGIAPELTAAVRVSASGSGIPPERIIVAATHTHTGPAYEADLRGWLEKKDPDAYPARLVAAVADSILRAASTAAPLRISVGTARQESPIAFCRRFVMKDGKVRTWARFNDPDTVREANPIDPEVAVLLFSSAVASDGGAKAILVNFALHLDTVGGTRWSADFPHDMGLVLRTELGPGVLPIFANGCCGDINHVDPRAEARNSTEVIGTSLGETVRRSLTSLQEVTPRLAVSRALVRAPLQEPSEEELTWARASVDKEKAGEKIAFLDQVRAHKLLRLERLRRQGPDLALEVHAIRLGTGAAMVIFPGEVFVELGLAIKKASPFKTTFVIELANTDETIYIPTREAYALGGYEVINSTLAPGGGELLRDAAIRLLDGLK